MAKAPPTSQHLAAQLAATQAELAQARADNHRLRAVLEAVRKTNSELDIDVALEAVLEAAHDVFGADRSLILLAGPHADQRIVRCSRGLSAAYRQHLETGYVPLARLTQQVGGFVVKDVHAPGPVEFTPELLRLFDAEGIRAIAGVGLRHGGELLGALVAYFDQPRDFSAADLDLARTFADQAALALVHAQDFELVSQLKAQRERSESRLQAILDRIRDVVLVWSPGMDLLLANRQAKDALRELGADEHNLQPLIELMPPEDNCPIKQAFREGVAVLDCEVMIGEHMWAVDCLPMHDPRTGELLAVVQHARNVTTNYELQRELASREEYERLMFERAPVGVIRFEGPDHRIVRVNQKLACWGRVREEDIVGSRLFDWFVSGDHAALRAAMDEALAQGESVVENCHLRLPRGDSLPVSITFGAFSRPSGVQLQAFVKNISKRLRLQQQIVEQEKLAAIGQLASGVAHELRNPIGIIASAIYDLEEILQIEDAEVREDLAIARDEILRVQEIINNVLDFARPSSSEREWVDLAEMMRQTVALLRKSLAARDVVVKLELADLPEIWAHRGSLRQIALNLLTNSFQATPDGGTITIKAWSVDKDKVAFAVSDTGQGIAPEHLSSVFNPFFTTKSPGGGTGLGLSIVYTTVREHGGEIQVSSQPGYGATFTVQLPRHTAAAGRRQRRTPLAAAMDELL